MDERCLNVEWPRLTNVRDPIIVIASATDYSIQVAGLSLNLDLILFASRSIPISFFSSEAGLLDLLSYGNNNSAISQGFVMFLTGIHDAFQNIFFYQSWCAVPGSLLAYHNFLVDWSK